MMLPPSLLKFVDLLYFTSMNPLSSSDASSNPISIPEGLWAQDQELTAAIPSQKSPRKNAGRRPKFTKSDDLIIVREVEEAKANLTGFVEITNLFGKPLRMPPRTRTFPKP